MQQKQPKGFWRNLADTIKSNRSNASVAYNEDFMIIGPLAILGAVVGGVGGAIALPIMYATNFGSALTMVLSGLVPGAVAGGATPLALHKLSYANFWGYLNPRNYKKAWDATKAEKAKAAGQATTPSRKYYTPKAKAAAPSKLDQASSPKDALNQAVANDDTGAEEKKTPAATPPKAADNKPR